MARHLSPKTNGEMKTKEMFPEGLCCYVVDVASKG